MISDTKSGRYCTDLDVYTSKKQVSVYAKCYNKIIMPPGCLLCIYLSVHTNKFLHSLLDLVIAGHNQVHGK